MFVAVVRRDRFPRCRQQGQLDDLHHRADLRVRAAHLVADLDGLLEVVPLRVGVVVPEDPAEAVGARCARLLVVNARLCAAFRAGLLWRVRTIDQLS